MARGLTLLTLSVCFGLLGWPFAGGQAAGTGGTSAPPPTPTTASTAPVATPAATRPEPTLPAGVHRPWGRAATAAGDENWASGFDLTGLGGGTLTGANAIAVDPAGGSYVGGDFTIAAGRPANYVAHWTPDGGWQPLSGGLNGVINALALDGVGNLYATGVFTTAGALGGVNNVAKWDPIAGSWSALGTGLSGGAGNVLLVSGGDVYVGGCFTSAGGVANTAHIARWNTASSTWNAVGGGTNDCVNALTFDGAGKLYAAGAFSLAGTTTASAIARFDNPGWAALGSGLTGTPSRGPSAFALAVSGTGLYVGGQIGRAGGNPVHFLARWDTIASTWSDVGGGTGGVVHALAVSGGTLYVGGIFANVGTSLSPASNLAQWNGTSWSALASSSSNGADNDVRALALSGSTLYVGGTFTRAGPLTAARGIAAWTGTAWVPVGAGTNGTVRALVEDGAGHLYAGGDFTVIGGVSASLIAVWDGTTWSALGSGISGIGSGVAALAVSGTTVYAGGSFATAGGNPAVNVARWDGAAWSALGSGVDGTVNALVLSGTTLYAAGSFTHAGGNPASRIARWNGAAWSILGTSGDEGVNGTVYALALSGSTLYAGGGFTQAGMYVVANGIGRWDGAQWSPLANGLDGPVFALAAAGNTIYAGGTFTHTGNTGTTIAVGHVARWDGTAWSALGSGTDNLVDALALSGANLYAGGTFNQAGGNPARQIARWDGANWATLGSGINSTVVALAMRGTTVGVGGVFTTAGTKSASNLSRWTEPAIPPTPTPTATPTSTPVNSGGSLGNLRFIQPVRIVDTRAASQNGTGPIGFQPNGQPITVGQLPAGSVTRFKLAGQTFGTTTIPADATGVLVNVTLAQGSPGGGFLTVYPGSAASPPNASTLNPSTAIAANFWTVGLAPAGGLNAGTIAVYSVADPRDLIVDLVGYYSPSNPAAVGNLSFITPVRVLDTRPLAQNGTGPIGFQPNGSPITAGTLTPNAINRFLLAAKTFTGTTFPSDVTGILAHVTTVQGSASGGFTTLLPGDFAGTPNVSTVNPSTAVAFNSWANGIPTTGGPGLAGTFGLYSTNALDVIVDVVGYFAPSNPSTVGNLTLVTPARVVETRGAPFGPIGFLAGGSPMSAGQLAPGSTTRYLLNGQSFGGLTLPADLKGALVNVTIVQNQAAGGFLTVYPGDAPAAPNTSTVNPSTAIAASFWASGIATSAGFPGTLAATSVGDPRDLLIDLVGYYR